MSGFRLLLLYGFMGYTGTTLHPKYIMWTNNHLKMKKHKDLLRETNF
jgi:hypothetical protein